MSETWDPDAVARYRDFMLLEEGSDAHEAAVTRAGADEPRPPRDLARGDLVVTPDERLWRTTSEVEDGIVTLEQCEWTFVATASAFGTGLTPAPFRCESVRLPTCFVRRFVDPER